MCANVLPLWAWGGLYGSGAAKAWARCNPGVGPRDRQRVTPVWDHARDGQSVTTGWDHVVNYGHDVSAVWAMRVLCGSCVG